MEDAQLRSPGLGEVIYIGVASLQSAMNEEQAALFVMPGRWPVSTAASAAAAASKAPGYHKSSVLTLAVCQLRYKQPNGCVTKVKSILSKKKVKSIACADAAGALDMYLPLGMG